MPIDLPSNNGERTRAERCLYFALGFAVCLTIVLTIQYLKSCCKIGGRLGGWEWSFSAHAPAPAAPATATAATAALATAATEGPQDEAWLSSCCLLVWVSLRDCFLLDGYYDKSIDWCLYTWLRQYIWCLLVLCFEHRFQLGINQNFWVFFFYNFL